MKKADILRIMAAIIYPAVDDVDTAMDKADEIYDKYNLFDPNTKEYEEGNDPETELAKANIRLFEKLHRGDYVTAKETTSFEELLAKLSDSNND